MTGTTETASYVAKDGFTTVPLKLEERESVFVVFRHITATASRTELVTAELKTTTVDGPWELSFPAKTGAPPSLRLEKLSSWTDSADAGVKYFSGTATYTKTVSAPAIWFGQESESISTWARCVTSPRFRSTVNPSALYGLRRTNWMSPAH